MLFLLRFVKLCAAFVNILLRLWLSSRLPSSLAAVHVAAFLPHCRLSLFNDIQTVILFLFLLNVLWIDSELLWHSSYQPCTSADQCTASSQNRLSPASHSKNRLWNWYGYFSRAQAYTCPHRPQEARRSKTEMWNPTRDGKVAKETSNIFVN